MGNSILDDMISSGNRIAQLRKSEIDLLQDFIQPLVEAPTQHYQGLENTETDINPPLIPEIGRLEEEQTHSLPPSLDQLATASTPPATTGTATIPPVNEDDLGCDWRDFGLSLDHMLSVTDQLNANNLVLDAERDGLETDLWLWSDG